jgi:PAS domain S-box-containing protein
MTPQPIAADDCRTKGPEELRRLRLAIEASGEIVFTTDTRGTFTYVNPAFERAYGYTCAEVAGRATPRILKGGATDRGAYESFWGELKAKRVVWREFTNRTKNGSLLSVECSANPIIDDEGEVVGFLAVQRDVTARKTMEAERSELERQLLQSQKMEAVGRLAGGIAHDFNNLLTAILGYSELLADQVRGAPQMLADLNEIRKAGERASRLTRQLLAFSRKQAMIREIVDLNSVVADITTMLRRVLGEDIALSATRGSDLWEVCADAGQIEQVLLNLAVNARDAMPKGGRLAITTANCDLDEAFARRHPGAAPGSYVALAVQDAGCGMAPEVVAHVFEPFFTTKPVGQGTGLGLSTVYGIVQQHGGCITIDSQVGSGTTITVYWPKRDDARDAIAAVDAPAQRAHTGTETILLVEDEPGIRSLMRKTLEPCGYRVLETHDVAEAQVLAATYRHPIDLLLSDVIMPGLSGPDLAQRVVARRPGIKILYVSGFPNAFVSQHDWKRERIAFLQKPFTPHALIEKVRESLDS